MEQRRYEYLLLTCAQFIGYRAVLQATQPTSPMCTRLPHLMLMLIDTQVDTAKPDNHHSVIPCAIMFRKPHLSCTIVVGPGTITPRRCQPSEFRFFALASTFRGRSRIIILPRPWSLNNNVQTSFCFYFNLLVLGLM